MLLFTFSDIINSYIYVQLKDGENVEKAAKKLCERLEINYTPEFPHFYEEGILLYEKYDKAITDTDRIIRLNDKYNFFRTWLSDVIKAAKLVEEDEDLLLFTYILYAMIKENSPLTKMKMPDRGKMDTDFAPMFSLLFFLEDMIMDMEKRGLPHKIISDTLQGFDAEINDYYGIFGRSGMRIYVEWFMLFVKCKLIRVGRLNFEMSSFNQNIRVYEKDGDIKILIDGAFLHEKGMLAGSAGQEDEIGIYFAEIEENGDLISGYGVNEYGEAVKEKITLKGYKEVLRKGDNFASIHIPAKEPFSKEECEKSINEAAKIFDTYYPEFNFKAYCTFSWMMEKRLRTIMGRDTNITEFSDLFYAFPLKDSGKGVYIFLYHKEGIVPPEALSEDTSMQRAVKKYLMDGNYFYEKGGVRLK